MTLDLDAFNDLADVDTELDESVVDRLRFDPQLEVPHQLTDVDVWLNYCNDDLYYLDKEVRSIIAKSRYSRLTKGQMKTAVPLVFLQIAGRKAGPEDSAVCRMLHKLLRYYCTRYTGTSKIAGMRFSRVYHFSKYACGSKRALSLRLRLEESGGNDNSFREYNAGEDKSSKSRRGVAAHGPSSDVGGRVPE